MQLLSDLWYMWQVITDLGYMSSYSRAFAGSQWRSKTNRDQIIHEGLSWSSLPRSPKRGTQIGRWVVNRCNHGQNIETGYYLLRINGAFSSCTGVSCLKSQNNRDVSWKLRAHTFDHGIICPLAHHNPDPDYETCSIHGLFPRGNRKNEIEAMHL